MPSSRRTLRRRERPRADMESAPTNGGEARSNRETAVTAAMENPCRGRFNIGPVCGGTGVRGRGMPSPANRGERPTKRDGPDHPGNRRAGCPHPAGPAASHGPAERSRPFPTNGAGRAANRENHGPYSTTNLCRGRCLHRPGDPAATRTSAGGACPSPTNHGKRPTKRDGPDHPGNRRAGCPHPAGPCGGANIRGRDKSRPYE